MDGEIVFTIGRYVNNRHSGIHLCIDSGNIAETAYLFRLLFHGLSRSINNVETVGKIRFVNVRFHRDLISTGSKVDGRGYDPCIQGLDGILVIIYG